MIQPGAGVRQFQLFGVGMVLKRLTAMEKKSKSAMVVGLQKCMLLIEKETVKLISFGELRAVKTGRLRSTIGSGIINITEYTAEGAVYAGTNYAMIVHEGWGRHSRARPFLRRAAKNKFNRVVTVMNKHMRSYYNINRIAG